MEKSEAELSIAAQITGDEQLGRFQYWTARFGSMWGDIAKIAAPIAILTVSFVLFAYVRSSGAPFPVGDLLLNAALLLIIAVAFILITIWGLLVLVTPAAIRFQNAHHLGGLNRKVGVYWCLCGPFVAAMASLILYLVVEASSYFPSQNKMF